MRDQSKKFQQRFFVKIGEDNDEIRSWKYSRKKEEFHR